MEEQIKKYLFLLFVGLLLFYSYLIIKDFIVILLSSLIIAYLLLPLHKKISKKTNPYLSSFICLIILVIFLAFLFLFIGQTIYTQVKEIADKNLINNITENTKKILEEKDIYYIEKVFPSIEKYLEKALLFIGNLFINFLKGVISFIIILFLTYFLLIYWEDIKKRLYKNLPLKNKDKFFDDIKKTSDGIIKGTLLVSLIEIIFSLIFFYFVGIKYALFLALIIGILAFIPMIGPGIFWMPILVFNLLTKNYLLAISFLIYGIIISYGIDGLLRNIISSKQTKINPIIMFLGVLGGIKTFGIIGIIAGPIILSLTLKIILSETN